MLKNSHLRGLNHKKLVQYMAEHAGDNAAWQEFIRRFQNFIAAVIINECKRLHYKEGYERIEDLLHNVYVRLLANESRALRNFKGKFENSIVSYLKLIAINVVRSDRLVTSRHPVVNQPAVESVYQDMVPDSGSEERLEAGALEQAIQDCLGLIEEQRRNGARDVLLFRCVFFEEMSVEEVADLPEFKTLSEKRIANIVSEIKAALRDCLQRGGYD